MFEITIRSLYQIGLAYMRKPRCIESSRCIETKFRCWPIDLDIFMHMNNAKYIRVAELCRWSAFPGSGMLTMFQEVGASFLVADQRVQYFKPIRPFQTYVVRTSIAYSVTNEKWLYYTHTFMQDPSSVKQGQDQTIYASVKVKVMFVDCYFLGCTLQYIILTIITFMICLTRRS